MSMGMSKEQAKEFENVMKEGRFHFAINSLQKVMRANPNRHFIFSPSCIYEGLFTTYLMVKGEIEERLGHILFVGEISKSNLINYGNYKMNLKDESVEYPCNRDVRCWVKHHTRLDYALCYFLNVPHQLDMSTNSKIKINHINRVLKKTVDEYIGDPIKLAVIEQDIEFALMSSICCKFQIVPPDYQAGAALTTNDNRIISYYHHELSMHVTEKSYQNGNVSLFVFVPASLISGRWMINNNINNTDLSYLIERLSSSEGIDKLRNLLVDSRRIESKTDTRLSVIPVFNMESDLTIRQLLQALGAQQLLMSDMIYLDGSYKKEEDRPSVHIDNAVHRSHVQVTRKEVFAGAMTLIHTGKDSSVYNDMFDLSRHYPFVWLIYDRLQREILFVGLFN